MNNVVPLSDICPDINANVSIDTKNSAQNSRKF